MDTLTIDANRHNSTMRRLANQRQKLRAEWLYSLYSHCGVVYDTMSAAHDAIATMRATCRKLANANFAVMWTADGYHVSLR